MKYIKNTNDLTGQVTYMSENNRVKLGRVIYHGITWYITWVDNDLKGTKRGLESAKRFAEKFI